jgi:hypothetical protein
MADLQRPSMPRRRAIEQRPRMQSHASVLLSRSGS